MASEEPPRRLAAVLFTDIVGSTAATAESQAAGLALRDRHRALVRAQVERFPLEAGPEALERLRRGSLRGAAVLVPAGTGSP